MLAKIAMLRATAISPVVDLATSNMPKIKIQLNIDTANIRLSNLRVINTPHSYAVAKAVGFSRLVS